MFKTRILFKNIKQLKDVGLANPWICKAIV